MPLLFCFDTHHRSYLVFELVLGRLQHLVEVITHDESKFANDSHDEEDGGNDLDRKDLDIKLDQPPPAFLVKSLPCIKHANAAIAAQDLRLDLSTKGPVEGHNGLILFWKHRSLHTLEGDLGWDDNADESAAGDEYYEDHFDQGDLLHSLGIAAVCLWVAKLVLNREKQTSGDIHGSLLGDSEDSSWKEDVLGCLEGRKATVPGLGRRVRYDDVGPDHLNAAEANSCDNRDDSAETAICGSEEANDGAVNEVVNQGNVETAETGEWAAYGAEMLDCGTELGCDRRSLDEEEFGLKFLEVLLLGLLILREKRSINFGRFILDNGLEGSSSRGLDHGQSSHEIAIGVIDLFSRQ